MNDTARTEYDEPGIGRYYVNEPWPPGIRFRLTKRMREVLAEAVSEDGDVITDGLRAHTGVSSTSPRTVKCLLWAGLLCAESYGSGSYHEPTSEARRILVDDTYVPIHVRANPTLFFGNFPECMEATK